MRNIRKLVLLGLAALMACAAVVAPASANEVRDASTHTALAVGSSINGSSTNSKLVGTFFGVSTTLTCSSSAFVGALTANSPTPTATISALTWTACKNSSGTTCNVTTLNMPWTSALMVNSTTAISLAVPSNGGVQISGTGCLPLSSTCTFGAGQTINFAWSNTTSVATVNQAVTSPTCGNSTWSAAYTIRTGSTPGSGNFIEIV